MTTDEIIETAIQGHASTRDAIRWAIVQEREACAKLVEADGLARGEYGYMLTKAATRIRARGAFVHASDMSQERVDETAKSKQEPVAWSVFDKRTGKHWYTNDSKGIASGYAEHYGHREPDGSSSMVVMPLYPAPVHAIEQAESLDKLVAENQRLGLYDSPKREWVGLTDEEIKEIIGPWGDTHIKGYTRKLFDQIEAKLKERNT